MSVLAYIGGVRRRRDPRVPTPRRCEHIVIAALKQILAIIVAISVTFAALGLILAFGLFAWLGIPLLAVGLGLLSAAVDDVT